MPTPSFPISQRASSRLLDALTSLHRTSLDAMSKGLLEQSESQSVAIGLTKTRPGHDAKLPIICSLKEVNTMETCDLCGQEVPREMSARVGGTEYAPDILWLCWECYGYCLDCESCKCPSCEIERDIKAGC